MKKNASRRAVAHRRHNQEIKAKGTRERITLRLVRHDEIGQMAQIRRTRSAAEIRFMQTSFGSLAIALEMNWKAEDGVFVS